MNCIRNLSALRLCSPVLTGNGFVAFGTRSVGSHCARRCSQFPISSRASAATAVRVKHNYPYSGIVRGLADQRGKTPDSEKEPSEQVRPDKMVNDSLKESLQVSPSDKAGSEGSPAASKKSGSDLKPTEFALRDETPKSSARDAVQGVPDPVRMQKMTHSEEASTDSGGYLKLKDIGFKDKEVDETMERELRADERIKMYNPKDTARRNELPYDLLKSTKKADKDKPEKDKKEDKVDDKKGSTKKGKDPEDTIEESGRKQGDTLEATDSDRDQKKTQMKNRDQDDDDMDNSRETKRSSRKSDDSEEKGERKSSSKQRKSNKSDEEETGDSDEKDDRRSTKRSTQQSVLWENSRRSTSGAQASSDSSGVGQLTEQLLDRDEADKRADQKDHSEGEKWKEGAREEGVKVHEEKDENAPKKKPRS